jgi:hypothetical protein
MKNSSNPITILGTILAVVLCLAISGIAQVGGDLPLAPTVKTVMSAPFAQEVPQCASPLSSSSTGHAPSQVNARAHSVTLSWKASVPRSSSQQDAIQGYYVYRSLTSNKYDDTKKINAKPLSGTQCVDTAVEPQVTYFYVVRAISGRGMSNNSNEATAPIPFP